MIASLMIVIVISLMVFIFLSMKGPPRKLSDLKVPLDILLKRGFDCGTLIVDHKKSKKFVQFRKYIHKKGDYGVQLAFPNFEWSKGFISNFKAQALKYGLVISEPSWTLDNKGAFLVIDFVKDSDKAYQFMRVIFLDVFGFSESDIYFVSLNGVSVKDELIDR